MSNGWYVSRADHVFGPYSWERVLELAREGSIGADDLVMRPGSDEWARADTVPAFAGRAATLPTAAEVPAAPVFARPAAIVSDMSTETPAPVTTATAEPAESVENSVSATAAASAQDPVPSDPEVPERSPRKRFSRRPSKRTVLKVAAAIAVVLAAGAAVWVLPDVFRDRGRSEPPKAGNVIETKSAGNVQRNRIVVRLEDGATKADVEQLASQLKGGGRIVGEWRNLGFYTIEFSGTTEDELATALKTASEAKGIRSVLPDRLPKP